MTQLSKRSISNPMAECMLVRYACQALMTPDRDAAIERPLMSYIDACLKARTKHEMVTLAPKWALRKLEEFRRNLMRI
jgi:hypothetical protein